MTLIRTFLCLTLLAGCGPASHPAPLPATHPASPEAPEAPVAELRMLRAAEAPTPEQNSQHREARHVH